MSVLNKLLIVFFLFASVRVVSSCAAGEVNSGCMDGDLTVREIVDRRGNIHFRHSASCLPKSGGLQASDSKHDSFIALEAYWPGFISSQELFHYSEVERSEFHRSYLILRFGPTPLMIQSKIEGAKRRSDFLANEFEYAVHVQSSEDEQRKFFFHNEVESFYAECASGYCAISGIHEKYRIRYSLQIFDSTIQDWLKMHKIILDFIEMSLIKD